MKISEFTYFILDCLSALLFLLILKKCLPKFNFFIFYPLLLPKDFLFYCQFIYLVYQILNPFYFIQMIIIIIIFLKIIILFPLFSNLQYSVMKSNFSYFKPQTSILLFLHPIFLAWFRLKYLYDILSQTFLNLSVMIINDLGFAFIAFCFLN